MHVAIIMNGNSRWAAQRGLPPEAGRIEGVAALRNTVELAADAGVRTLTLYAICTPDSARPKPEIAADLSVLGGYLGEAQRCSERSVRIRCDRQLRTIEHGIAPRLRLQYAAGLRGSRMQLRIVVDYSAHDDVVKATWRSATHAHRRPSTGSCVRSTAPPSPPARSTCWSARVAAIFKALSCFGEVAYARLHYVDCLWPDFTAHRFQRALAGYSGYACGDAQVVSIA